MSIVRFTDVSYRYPGAGDDVLRHVDLEVPEAAFCLLVGPTGSGKSTLLRAMNGLVPHFSGGRFAGRVHVAGRDTLECAPRDLADVAAFVPQDPAASFVVDRVEDELAYALENLGVDPAAMRRRVEEVLDLLDIEGLRERSVRTLSGGERQRVAIAAALAPGARLLLLDEPTSQLDPQGAEDVLAGLHRLVHDLGMTVVLAEHRLERVAGFADSAIGCPGAGSVVTGDVREVLDELRLGPPVAHLGRALGWSPLPLTVREARRHASPLPEPAGPGRDEPRRALPLYESAAGQGHGDMGRGLGPSAGLPGERDEQGASLLVEARALTAGYDGGPALRGVDLSVRSGEVVAVMGRNGAGKSTLLRCLAGLHAPDSGSVRIAGGATPEPGRDVALTPQRPEDLLFAETVREEVALTLASHPEASRSEEVLEPFGLAAFSSRHPRDLSAGQRLLLAVAVTFALPAPVGLLDEPTRGLDPASKSLLIGALGRAADAGRAVVVATHDVELVAELADRVVLLARGEVIAEGRPEMVIGDSPVFAPQMARVFGPRVLTVGDALEFAGT